MTEMKKMTTETTTNQQLYLDMLNMSKDELMALRKRADDPNDPDYVTLQYAINHYKGTPEAQEHDFSAFFDGIEQADPDKWGGLSETTTSPIKAVTLVVYFDGSIPQETLEEAVLDITSLEYLSDNTDEHFRMAVGQTLPLDSDESVEFYVEDKDDLDEPFPLEMDDLREGRDWPVIVLRTDVE